MSINYRVVKYFLLCLARYYFSTIYLVLILLATSKATRSQELVGASGGLPHKVSGRRSSSVTSSGKEIRPSKLSVRRVTFSEEDNIRVYHVDVPPNNGLRSGNDLTIAEQIRTQTQDCVVSLQRLKLPQLEAKSNEVRKQQSPREQGGNVAR